jgi:hypothetical protein
MIETGTDRVLVVNGDEPVGLLPLDQIEELLR